MAAAGGGQVVPTPVSSAHPAPSSSRVTPPRSVTLCPDGRRSRPATSTAGTRPDRHRPGPVSSPVAPSARRRARVRRGSPRRTRWTRCRPATAGDRSPRPDGRRHGPQPWLDDQGRGLEVVDPGRDPAAGSARSGRSPGAVVPGPVDGAGVHAEREEEQDEGPRSSNGQGLTSSPIAPDQGPAPAHDRTARRPRGRRPGPGRAQPAHRRTAAASAEPPPRPAPGGIRLTRCDRGRARPTAPGPGHQVVRARWHRTPPRPDGPSGRTPRRWTARHPRRPRGVSARSSVTISDSSRW